MTSQTQIIKLAIQRFTKKTNFWMIIYQKFEHETWRKKQKRQLCVNKKLGKELEKVNKSIKEKQNFKDKEKRIYKLLIKVKGDEGKNKQKLKLEINQRIKKMEND
ncbi:unnamed protein product [Paramecium octaurelia]|uniref:Uncharacterized protein n=1 Tax=Paramecium octaurelia TaxID=43137 RepID=A0A8S1S8Y1_PAROT|nr:unnamed protein product [Paramecium octaurelia]